MGNEWRGYILLQKPTLLSLADWRTSLTALYQALNRRSTDPSPAKRLHYRLSLDQTKVIIEAAFDTDDLTLNRLATYIANALEGKYTVAQVKTAITSNTTLWRLNGARNDSGDDCRAYLAANSAAWEAEAS